MDVVSLDTSIMPRIEESLLNHTLQRHGFSPTRRHDDIERKSEGLESPSEAGVALGVPCVFKGCRGFFHAGAGDVGVVLCAPWGAEDHAVRKPWRLLAEAIAGHGLPALRFDYPGTGESQGAMTSIGDVAQWVHSVGAAADFLRAYSGVKRFVFVGRSLGAALALEAAAARGDVAGLVLIMPTVNGRDFLSPAMSRGGSSIQQTELARFGFALSGAMVESFKTFDPTRSGLGAVKQAVVFDRADRKAGAEVLEHCKRNGAAAVFEAIGSYPSAMAAHVPVEAVVAALSRFLPAKSSALAPRVPLLPATLRGEVFKEEPLAFGPQAMLRGLLCMPAKPEPATPVLVLVDGATRDGTITSRIGWGRGTVDQARALAAAGIASLRFDCAGVGESPDQPGRIEAQARDAGRLADVRAAVDALVARGFKRIVLMGREDGATLALAAAAGDPRVAHVVAAGPLHLVCNPSDTTAEDGSAIRRDRGDGAAVHRFVHATRSWRDRGVAAFQSGLRRRGRALNALVPLVMRSLILRDPRPARVLRQFKALSERAASVSLVYAGCDPGLLELRAYFGASGRKLRLPGASVSILTEAETGLRDRVATAWLHDHLIDVMGAPLLLAPDVLLAPGAERRAA